MLNYNHLYYFHIAASEGTVAAAAGKLGVAQPTVSEQLRALERSLGVVLFDRGPSGLKLTEAGKLAFEHSSVMFRAGERLVESLARDAPALPGTLRVGVSSAVARATSSSFLMPLLALPACVPVIRTGDSNDVLRELHAHELDLALCENEPPEAARRGLEVATIASTTLVVVAPPTLAPNADWSNIGFIHYRASSSYRWEAEAFLAAGGFHPQIVAEADDALFLVEAASRGYAGVAPRSVARDAIATGRLRVLAKLPASPSGIHAIFFDGTAGDLARRAAALLVEQARGEPE